MTEPVHVFYTINDKYASLLSLSIASLIEHTSSDIEVHVVYEELSSENMARLEALSTDNVNVSFLDMSADDSLKDLLKAEFFPPVTFYRLFLSVLFPNVSRGIYLDSDTIIVGDIAELYNIDLQDNYLGAVQDYTVLPIDGFVSYIEKSVGVPVMKYFNSGVIVFDFDKLREKKIDEHIKQLLSYNTPLIAPDQDVLNSLCLDRVLYIDPKWNTMPSPRQPEINKPEILHFNLNSKPWHYKIEHDEEFWKYVNKSAFYHEIMTEQSEFKSDPDLQIQERTYIDSMVAKAADLAKNDPGLAELYNSKKVERL